MTQIALSNVFIALYFRGELNKNSDEYIQADYDTRTVE
jgi:hypothetical protein